MPQNQPIESLYERYLANELNGEELADFLLRLNDPANEATVSGLMDGTWREMFEKEQAGVASHQVSVVPMYRRKAFRWIAAAAIIIVIAAIAYLSTIGVPAKTPSPVGVHANDVPAPTNTRAVITLANGTKVYLDSAGNGTIAQQNSVDVLKNENGEIEYRSQRSDIGGTIAYNTLSNPRGSKVINLTLSDGTKVWLNSESSLKYPTAFTATTREVEITGEAYFEVKHNAKQPFKVHLPNGGIVEDIGTAFNVNAYTDEAAIKTTLVEGVVRVYASTPLSMTRNGGVTMKPGQQAAVTLSTSDKDATAGHEGRTAGAVKLTNDVDLEETLAWKNGLFVMNNADVATIMRQLSRWYNVTIVYQGAIPKARISGDLPRTMSLSKVLQVLETSGVKAKIEGNTLTVSE